MRTFEHERGKGVVGGGGCGAPVRLRGGSGH
jgi:hypothetical protein